MSAAETISMSRMPMAPRDTTMIGAQAQQVWGFCAVLNFTFGGAGAALYLLCIFFHFSAGNITGTISFPWLRFVAAGLVAAGLIVLAREAGRPLRARFLLRNLRRSWMSRETLAAMIFLPASCLSAWIEHPLLLGTASAAAATLIISHGCIIYRARAIPAWNTPLIPPVFFTSALVSGSGVLLAVSAMIGPHTWNLSVLTAIVICTISDAIVWLLYLESRGDPLTRRVTAPFRTRSKLFGGITLFRLAPIAMLLIVSAIPINSLLSRFLLAGAGVLLFSGACAQKTIIIREFGYLRSINLRLEPAISATSAKT